MTVVSVLLGAAVEVGVGSKPTSPSKSTSLFLYHIINFSDVLASEMILGRNICWSLHIFNIVYYFQASVSIRSRYSLYIDDCVSTTKHSSPIRRVMQRKRA